MSGWNETSKAYEAELRSTNDRVARLRLLSLFPGFSIWRNVREELDAAAEEIERLRRRVEELENDGG
jgi:hypothetical protein